MNYKPIMAIDVHRDLYQTYGDIPVYVKHRDAFCPVVYMGWHTEGSTWLGGTFDIEAEGIDYDLQIDPYDYLYIVDQSSCEHTWIDVATGDLEEKKCRLCGQRSPIDPPASESSSTDCLYQDFQAALEALRGMVDLTVPDRDFDQQRERVKALKERVMKLEYQEG